MRALFLCMLATAGGAEAAESTSSDDVLLSVKAAVSAPDVSKAYHANKALADDVFGKLTDEEKIRLVLAVAIRDGQVKHWRERWEQDTKELATDLSKINNIKMKLSFQRSLAEAKLKVATQKLEPEGQESEQQAAEEK
jgi:hypothetical protein